MPAILPAQEYLPGKDFYNWTFGYHSYINFDTPDGVPVADTTSSINTSEGCVTISDRFGNLLFYSDGVNVYNSRGKKMVNGDSLGGHYSSTQSCVAIKKKNEPGKFYLFTIEAAESQIKHGLAYSIIDCNYMNGIGRVEKKNVHLSYGLKERMAAVVHANNVDHWIVTHDNIDTFLAFQISDDNMKSPVLSKISKDILTNYSTTMKFSGDGNSFCTNYFGSIDLFDFNRKTGKVSHKFSIKKDSLEYLYGIEFSPDGNMLYVSDFTAIYRYDLSLGIPTTIMNNEKVIAEGYYAGLQIGPDGRIYCSKVNSKFLDAIENPDSRNDYEFLKDFIDLSDGRCLLGLPHTIQGKYKESLNIQYESPLCLGDTLILSSDEIRYADSLKWFGPDEIVIRSDSVMVYNCKPEHSGWWRLEIYIDEHSLKDSVLVEVHDPGEAELQPSGNIVICPGDTIYASSKSGFTEYYWNEEQGERMKKITSPGKYIIKAIDEYGCQTSDSLFVSLEKTIIDTSGVAVELGETCIMSAIQAGYNYRNTGDKPIIIEACYPANGKYMEVKSDRRYPFELNSASSFYQILEFSPDSVGIFHDTLIVHTSSPCPMILYIPCYGMGLPIESNLSLPSMTAEIGTRSYSIPLTTDLDCFENKNITLDYEVEIRFDAYIFEFDSITHGHILEDRIDGRMKILRFADSDIVLSDKPTVINNLVGLVLMSDYDKTPLIISDFKWTNKPVDVKIQNGHLQARGCMQNLQGLQYIEDVRISPNPGNGIISIEGAKDASLYFTDICGRQVKYIECKDNNIEIDLTDLTPGVYGIKIHKDGLTMYKIIRIIK